MRKKHAKARQRRRLRAQERLVRDRREAQQAAQALQQALEDLGLPEELVAEIEGRLHSLGARFWARQGPDSIVHTSWNSG
jgi:hypothetical protein